MKRGYDGGMQTNINGDSQYRETIPTARVKNAIEIFDRHEQVKVRMGGYYYTFIADIVCNPFRSKDWK
jgi:hypothetical protein